MNIWISRFNSVDRKKKLPPWKVPISHFFGRNEVKTRLFLIGYSYSPNDPKRLFLVHSGSPCQTGRILWKQLILNITVHFQKCQADLISHIWPLVLFEIVQSAPITNFTLVALWIFLVSRARSCCLSSVSSSVASILWCAGLAMSISVHSIVSLRTTVILDRLYFSRLSVEKVISQVILTSLFSASGKGWRLYPLSVHSNPYFLQSSIDRK